MILCFLGLQGSTASRPVAAVCCRDPAPEESFARSQLGAISLIFLDFMCLRGSSEDFMDVCISFGFMDWRAGWLVGSGCCLQGGGGGGAG